MLRRVALALLLANAVYFVWTQGFLAPLGWAPAPVQREPQRLAEQIEPERVRLLNGPRGTESVAPPAAPPPTATTAPATVSSAAPAAPSTPPPAPADATACWQAGGFTEGQTEALRNALGQLDLPRSWQFSEARSGGRWIVYMGRYDNQEQVERKKAELRELKVAFRELSATGLGPGLALGTYSSEVAAEKALADIVRTGVRTARVAQERAESSSFTLRLPRITPTQRNAVAGLGALLAGKPLKRCN